MIPLKINLRHILTLLVIGAFCLMPLCLSVWAADDSPSPQFVKVKSVHIDYDKVYGTEMVKNGSKVTIEVVLTNFSKVVEGNKSELFFHSDLGVLPSIIVDGTPKEYKTPFVVDHRTVKEVKVTLSGDAPEVNKRRENVTLLNITQKIKEEEDLVKDIKRDVSSRAIEDALSMWHEANETITKANEAIDNAEEAGLNVADAKKSLELANEHLNNSQQYYNQGSPEEALVEAEKALDSAKDAEAKVGSAVGGRTFRNYVIIAVVAVVVIIVFVLLLQQRRRKRGVY
ncbi:MAG: hypothetical protein ACXQTR_00555 [Candidatus Methanospirareceae archaeon]